MWSRGVRAVAALGVGFLAAGCAQFGSDGQGGGAPRVREVPTVLVVDSSGSMAEADAHGPRIDAAKQASSALMNALPEGTPTALITYGANTNDLPESQAESCQDITLLRPLSPVGDDVNGAVEGLSPGGFTPIGRALEAAATELAGADIEGEKAIVLISDGEDTCGDPTPCEAARSIKQAQPDVTISTIGFKSDVEELACVARETGGLYLTADNVDQLVSRVVAAQNAPAGAVALTPTGRSGIELGQHFDDIRSAHPDFPGQSNGVSEGDLTVIRWVDCDWVFGGDGRLVEIRDTQGSTIDGVGVGASAVELREVYGEPLESVAEPSGDGVVELHPASVAAGTAWKFTLDPDGKVTTVVLCRCLPGSGNTSGRSGSGGSRDLPAALPGWARDSGTTKVEILRAVDSAGRVQPGFTVRPDARNRCESSGKYVDWAAHTAVEPGTVQCDSTTAASATECWPDETGMTALCLGRDPYVLREIPSPRPLTGQPVDEEWPVVPLFATTRDGSECTYRFGGGNSSVEHNGKIYTTRAGCDDGLILLDSIGGVFFRSGDGVMAMATRDIKTVFPVEIDTVYFLGTA